MGLSDALLIASSTPMDMEGLLTREALTNEKCLSIQRVQPGKLS